MNSFQLIPVIDLMGGQVVHAKLGQREHYQPIQSQLCTSSNPLEVVAALMKLYPFSKLYIADLDAIRNNDAQFNNHYKTIQSIIKTFPTVEIWLDAGILVANDFNVWQELKLTYIIASEKFSHINDYLALVGKLTTPYVLSLDFMPEGYQGPQELLEQTSYWPKEVIVMSLPNVGADQGPNLALLKHTLQTSRGFNLYAAGGVRNGDDIAQLIESGISGALVATALHQKKITNAEITKLCA